MRIAQFLVLAGLIAVAMYSKDWYYMAGIAMLVLLGGCDAIATAIKGKL